jgi:hypothetical protein
VTVHATDSIGAYMHARRRYIRRGLVTEATLAGGKCGVRDEMDGGLMCHGRSGMPIFVFVYFCGQDFVHRCACEKYLFYPTPDTYSFPFVFVNIYYCADDEMRWWMKMEILKRGEPRLIAGNPAGTDVGGLGSCRSDLRSNGALIYRRRTLKEPFTL